MLKVYLAGAMSGIPHYNYPAFHAAAKNLRDQGYFVFSPAEQDIEILGFDPTTKPEWKPTPSFIKEVYSDDTQFIIHEADAIALIPGWENSKGARAEHALALALGLQFIYLR